MLTGLAGMPGVDSAAASAPSQARLGKAAHEFEAQLMKELLQPMTDRDLLGGDDDTVENGALGEFASESLAAGLSARGGFGIANRILGEFSHSEKGVGDSRAIGNVPADTGMSGHK